MHKFNIFILVIIIFTNCNEYPFSEEMLKKLYPVRDFKGIQPKVIYQNSIILNPGMKQNNIYVLRDKNEEMLCILENETIFMTDKYVMFNYGPMQYNKNLKGFEPEPIKDSNRPFIIQDISFKQLEGDQFNSVFISVFSEEPPIGFFLVPMIYRNGIKIFDGLNMLGEEELVKKWKTTSYTLESGKFFNVKFPGAEEIKYIWKENQFKRLP
jgi:hypothetical protein